MRKPSRVMAVCAVVVLAAACGDDGGGGGSAPALDQSEQEFADAISSAMIDSEGDDPANPLTDDDYRCVAGEIVGVMGVDGLVGVGLDLDAIAQGEDLEDVELDQDQADAIVDGMFRCVDFGEAMAAGMGLEESVSEDSRRCLGDVLADSEVFRDAMAAEILGQQTDDFEDLDRSAQAEIISAVTDCLSAEELVQIGLEGASDE